MADEFELYCENRLVRNLLNSMLFIGVFFGNLILGKHFHDIFNDFIG